jgi:hypothetical protein
LGSWIFAHANLGLVRLAEKRVGFFSNPLLHITRETDPLLLMAPVLLAQVPPDRTPCIGPAASAIHREFEKEA